MAANPETAYKQSDAIASLRIKHISGSVEGVNEGVHAVDVTVEDHGGAQGDESSDEEDQDPTVLQALSSEQLARRASFKRILDDLSSADQTLKGGGGSDPLAAAAAATLQAQQLQLQSALLNAHSLASSQSPLIAGAVQSLASQTNIPASLLSSALFNANMVANLSNATSTSSGLLSTSVTASPSMGVAGGTSPAAQVLDDTTRKREVRLMKNREAARECRRKKKEYVRCLENRVTVLESQNQALIGELRALKELYLPKSNQD